MISFYNRLPSKGQPHRSDGTMSIDDFISNIKFGKWRELIEPVRAEKDKKKRDELKRNLVSVTCSGVFAERREDSLINHSGFLCIDVDNFTDKSRIISDPYTYACFDSVSGLGFAVLVKIDPNKHKESFLFIQKHYFDNYGIVVDRAPQNVASLRYVSFDPTVEINSKSKTSKYLSEPKKRTPSLAIVLSDDKVSEYVKEAVNRGLNIAGSYFDYLNLSFALAQGFGESGRAYFHALSSQDAKYNSVHADRQYDLALKRGKTGVTVGTFYHMLKQGGIQIKNDSSKEVGIAAIAKKSGRTKEAVTRQLVEINGVNPQTAATLVEQVFSRDDITLKTVTVDPERLIESLVEWITQNHPLRRNCYTKLIEENGIVITTEKMNSIYLRARAAFNTSEVTFDLIKRVINSDFIPTFNPITEYIEKNSYRNSTGNIHAIATTISSNTKGSYMFLEKWLLGIIAVYMGQAVRYRLALVGIGRTGKTQWFRRLLPAGLKSMYGESSLDAGKDDELLMCQKLVLMDDELSSKSRVDEKRIKNLSSKNTFSLRVPYGTHNEDFDRLAILCGTANETDIITDRTGNTRYLVINVDSINHAAYNEIDKDELFMELYRTYIERGPECWYLNDIENDVLIESSDSHVEINPEMELLQKYFLPPSEPGFITEMTATDIKVHIESYSRQQIKSMKFFGIELKKFFGDARRTEKSRLYRVIIKPIN